MPRAIHLQKENSETLCGRKGNSVTDQSAVTCKNCLKKIQVASRPPRLERTPDSAPRASRSFFTKVAGVTHRNDDGSRRQQIIPRCSIGENLILRREPHNRVDTGAIKVTRSNGEQLGYLPAHVSRGGDASGLAHQMDAGTGYQCRITAITGGGPEKSWGVNIEVTDAAEFDGSVPQQYAHSDSVPGRIPTGVWLLLALAIVVILFLLIAGR